MTEDELIAACFNDEEITAPYFHPGQRIVCIDDKANSKIDSPRVLQLGQVYTVRAIFDEPIWSAPGWGVFLEGVELTNPVTGEEWPIDPRRFRPVEERETDAESMTKVREPEMA
jgi:hypothetical protein